VVVAVSERAIQAIETIAGYVFVLLAIVVMFTFGGW
jgi:hypothetical protein